MEFSESPFLLRDLPPRPGSVSCSSSSFSSLGTSSYASSSSSVSAAQYERIYNDFRKWLTTRYRAPDILAEADAPLFRAEWDRYLRASVHDLLAAESGYPTAAADVAASPVRDAYAAFSPELGGAFTHAEPDMGSVSFHRDLLRRASFGGAGALASRFRAFRAYRRRRRARARQARTLGSRRRTE